MSKITEDIRVWYLGLLLVVIIASYVPLEMQLTPAEYTIGAFTTIEDIEPGDKVLVLASITAFVSWENIANHASLFKHILDKGASIIVVSLGSDTVPFDMIMIRETITKMDPMYDSPLYGDRLVYVGFIPGAAAVVSVADSPRSVIGDVDYFGNSYDEMKATEDWDSGDDIKLVITNGGQWGYTQVITTFVNKYNVDYVMVGSAGDVTAYIQWFFQGLANGCVFGFRAGAEYEQLLQWTGPSSRFSVAVLGIASYLLISILIRSGYQLLKPNGGRS